MSAFKKSLIKLPADISSINKQKVNIGDPSGLEYRSRRWTRREMMAGIGAVLATCSLGGCVRFFEKSNSNNKEYPDVDLINDDLGLYADIHKAVSQGMSPDQAFDLYLSEGSRGLKTYARIYNVTAQNYTARLTSHPKYYSDLTTMMDRVKACEENIRKAVHNVLVLAPHTPLVPVYLFVGVMGHGATPREVTGEEGEENLGILIPVELVGRTDQTNLSEFPSVPNVSRIERLPWLIAHELTHVSQVRLQGLNQYRSIYRDPSLGIHLAYAIREGAADMVASLASGYMPGRAIYVAKNEAELWTEFSSLLYRPVSESRGWFNSPPSDWPVERPRAIGYGMGWAICKHYYDSSDNKSDALIEILSAVTIDDFEKIAAPYVMRFR